MKELNECILTLHEHMFFASREIGSEYYTEPLIGNYALMYALRWVESPYNATIPHYIQDLQKLEEQEYYITPATPINNVKIVTEQFNALKEGYFFEMERARSNYPQNGRIHMIARGTEFRFYAFSSENDIPKYIRLGKFLGKAKIAIRRKIPLNDLQEYKNAEYAGYLNPYDLKSIELLNYSLHSIHPTPLINSVKFNGIGVQLNPKEVLPWPMSFSFSD